MTTPRYSNQHLLSGRRLAFPELALAISVIVGLGFVALRVKTMVPDSWAAPAAATTVEAKTEAPPTAPAEAVAKTP
jgi:hypothetical protein